MSLLSEIVSVLPVQLVPEIIVQYLAGDCCLDDETISKVFHTVYRDLDGCTFMDETKSVPHSFNDEPGFSYDGYMPLKQWFRNGVPHRKNGPARITTLRGGEEEPQMVHIWMENGRVTETQIGQTKCHFTCDFCRTYIHLPGGGFLCTTVPKCNKFSILI